VKPLLLKYHASINLLHHGLSSQYRVCELEESSLECLLLVLWAFFPLFISLARVQALFANFCLKVSSFYANFLVMSQQEIDHD